MNYPTRACEHIKRDPQDFIWQRIGEGLCPGCAVPLTEQHTSAGEDRQHVHCPCCGAGWSATSEGPMQYDCSGNPPPE